MIRICKDGKKKYKSLGVSINPAHWNFAKNALRPTCPNYEQLIKLISDKEQELSAEVIRLKAENRYYTATTLIEGIAEQKKLKTVGEIFNKQMQRLADKGRRKYMLSLRYVYNTLIAFNRELLPTSPLIAICDSCLIFSLLLIIVAVSIS